MTFIKKYDIFRIIGLNILTASVLNGTASWKLQIFVNGRGWDRDSNRDMYRNSPVLKIQGHATTTT